MILLDDYETARQAVFDYFGYVEDWVVIPIDDQTDAYWHLTGESYGDVVQFGSKTNVTRLTGDHYENSIYTQRFLSKWVYRGQDFTMVCVDTCVDGNKFLQVFDNLKEIKDEGMESKS